MTSKVEFEIRKRQSNELVAIWDGRDGRDALVAFIEDEKAHGATAAYVTQDQHAKHYYAEIDGTQYLAQRR